MQESHHSPQADPGQLQPNVAADLHAFLSGPFTNINGWCLPQLWYAIYPLLEVIGRGPIAEIGVFEGKFFSALVKTFDPSLQHKHAAIDVFDMQQFNLDGAGVGKKDVFLRNMQSIGIEQPHVQLVRADSLMLGNMDAHDLIRNHGRFRAFSVDGCHDVPHTVHDIEFAMQVTAAEGLIFVDDYTNADWPGVAEAVAKMYLLREYPFVPLVVTSNKLMLCALSYHANYLAIVEDYIRKHHHAVRIKRVNRFGYPTLTLVPRFDVLDRFA